MGRWFLASAFLALLVLLNAGVSGAITEAGISGRVTDATGAGLSGISVMLYEAAGDIYLVSTVTSGNDGSYRFIGLQGGQYKVRFYARPAGYLDTWYSGASSFATATTVTVVEETETIDINAVLARGGSISGRVTDASGNPLPCYIYLEDVLLQNSIGYRSTTDPDGRYSITGLPTGSYRVSFSSSMDGYISEWYDDTVDYFDASLVAVTAPGETTGINAVLAGKGSIAGRVTDAAGNVIGGVQVRAYDATHYEGWVFTPYWAFTNPDGSYAIGGLREGSYKVRFDASNSGYLDQWYGGATNYGAAATVAVAPAGIRDNVDAVLVPGGKVTGTVTDANDAPLVGVSVSSRSATSIWSGPGSSAVTDGAGAYTLSGLRSGSYLLRFYSPDTYRMTWYGGTSDSSTAKAVSVMAPGTTAGVNVVLGESGAGDRGGAIAGYAANASDEFYGVDISVYDESMGVVERSHQNGSYSIGPLKSGRYKVLCEQTYPHYLRRWYGDSLDFSGAATITVTAPETTTGIDCRLGEGGTIRGQIYPNAGDLAYVRVDVYGATATLAASVETDLAGGGNYEVTGLPAGSYRLKFSNISHSNPPGVWPPATGARSFLGTWYGGDTFETAIPVIVTDYGTVEGVDVVLAPGGTIAGRVTFATAKGYGISVDVYDGDKGMVGSVTTLADGSYRVEGLPSGTYRLAFRKEGYATVWFGGGADFAAATPVAVTAPETVSVADTAMTAASGGIDGLVTDTAGLPVRSHVVVLDANETFVGSGTCDQDGYYQVTGLPTGRYRVVFDATNDGYVKSFFSNAVSAVGATPVQITASAMTTGINAVLAGGGSISGRVVNGRAEVVIFDGSGVEIDRMPTDESGYYRVFGVPSGSYRVFFRPISSINGYLSAAGQWYGGKGTFGAADPVTVVAPADTPNVNVTLGTGTFINATPGALNFGTAYTGGASRRTVRIGNYGIADIAIGTVGTSGENAGEFSVEYDSCSGRTLKAADECVVEVGFSPAATGARSALLAIPSDAANAPQLSLVLAGTGEAPPVLSLAIAGTGNGSVNSDPRGIACTAGICSAPFTAGAEVTLMAAPGSDSRFAGWSGDCSPPRDSGGTIPSCVATMDRDRSVTATFELQSLVKVPGLSPAYYSLIAGACGAVPVGGIPTVLIQDHEFGENLVFNRNQAVKLRGGYNEGFTTNGGMTTIRGSVTVVNGSLDVDRVIIK